MGKRTILLILFLLNVTLPTTYAASTQKEAGSSAVPTIEHPEQVQDRRVNVLSAYLETYNSPLAASAETFVAEADKNNIDWKLLASISGVESTFGHQIPYNSYNAWGWGIYGDNMIRFSSWDEAITTISGELKQRYIDKWGAKDVHQIGKYYAASPTWAQRVEYFMGKIDAFALKDPESLPISL